MPSASKADDMVLAVYMPPQEPVPGMARFSISLQVLVAHVAGGVLAHGLEHADDVQVLALLAGPAGWCRRRRRWPARWRAACPSCRRACSCRSRRPPARRPSTGRCTQVSMQSEMTSRLTSEYFMPSVPMAMPSEMVGVPKICALPPASSMPCDGRVGQLLQAAVAGRDGAVAVGHADHRLARSRLPRSPWRSTWSGWARATCLR